MLYKHGDVVWKMPIRYWEDQTPTRCVVEGEQRLEIHTSGQFNSSNLYVQADEYGHAVYVNPEDCYFSKEVAHDAAVLKKLLLSLRRRDELDVVMQRIGLVRNDEEKANVEWNNVYGVQPSVGSGDQPAAVVPAAPDATGN